MADLQTALNRLVDELVRLAQFPKYSLERRVDIFLVPFLEPFLDQQLRCCAAFVAPEFPILSDLREKGPAADVRAGGVTRRTVNADYLFHVASADRSQPRWLLVELKTDARSFEPDQADLYAIARLRGMAALRSDLAFVAEETGSSEKYAFLERALERVEATGGEELEIAYLAPERLRKRALAHEFPRTPAQRERFRQWPPGPTVTHFLSLDALVELTAEQVAARERSAAFAPLWPTVQRLLKSALDVSDE